MDLKRTHRTLIFPLLLALCCFGSFSQAMAQEDGGNPRNSPYGAVHLKVNTAWASCTINGDSCNTEYLNNGSTIVLRKLDRKITHKIVVQATMDNMHDGKVTVKPRDFKLRKLGPGVRAWQAHKKLRLRKRRGPAPKPEPEEEEPQPDPDEDEID